MGVMRRSSPAISDIHIQRIREISQDFDMGQRNFVLTCLESFQVRNLSLDTDFRHLCIGLKFVIFCIGSYLVCVCSLQSKRLSSSDLISSLRQFSSKSRALAYLLDERSFMQPDLTDGEEASEDDMSLLKALALVSLDGIPSSHMIGFQSVHGISWQTPVIDKQVTEPSRYMTRILSRESNQPSPHQPMHSESSLSPQRPTDFSAPSTEAAGFPACQQGNHPEAIPTAQAIVCFTMMGENEPSDDRCQSAEVNNAGEGGLADSTLKRVATAWPAARPAKLRRAAAADVFCL